MTFYIHSLQMYDNYCCTILKYGLGEMKIFIYLLTYKISQMYSKNDKNIDLHNNKIHAC